MSNMDDGINSALQQWKIDYIKTLTEGALEAHISGAVRGEHELGNDELDRDDMNLINDRALAFSETYGRMLTDEGASIINGEKIYWLRDMDEQNRNDITKIIRDGLAEGKPTGQKESGKGTYPKGSIARELQDYFTERKSHASMVARTEIARIQNISGMERYQARGIKQVEVLDGNGEASCPECDEANGQIWDLDYAMTHELEHPNCRRAFNPAGR